MEMISKLVAQYPLLGVVMAIATLILVLAFWRPTIGVWLANFLAKRHGYSLVWTVVPVPAMVASVVEAAKKP
jgi:hypothetical protein